VAAPTKVAPIQFGVATGPGRSCRLHSDTPHRAMVSVIIVENHELTILIGDDGRQAIEGKGSVLHELSVL